MSVLDRSALSDSPLADLHAIASELSIDGYRRLRRPELIDAILGKQGSDDGATTTSSTDEGGSARSSRSARSASEADNGDEGSSRRRRGRRGGRSRDAQDSAAERDETPVADASDDSAADDAKRDDAKRDDAKRDDAKRDDAKRDEPKAGDARADDTRDKPRRRRGSRTAEKGAEPEREAPGDTGDESGVVEGVVELLPNGSGFVRADGPYASDDDVYVSAAQIKRCELVSGDRVSGPKREPRRSERYASMVRIETINGRPAAELADNVRFDDLPATLPTERITIGSDDPTLEAIEWLTPFGKGSRVTITGAARAGKTETLRRLATALAGAEDLTLLVALAGVRPEELSEYANDPAGAPAAAVSFAASHDAAAAAVEPVIDQARRLAARGSDAVVLLDSLDGLSPHTARKVMASARNIVDGGSVTIVATANAPLGGETTVIALDAALAGIGRFPALDLPASGTLKPELLVGQPGAEAIARTRAEVLHGEDTDDGDAGDE